MRKYLVSLALVAVLGLAAGASTFTGAQETESPTDLSGSCVSVVSSPELDGTPDDATPDVGTPEVGTPAADGTPAVDGTPDTSATPEGTPEGTPSAEDCATPESTPDA
ncbi:MAG: hypothetical protein AVDCRST_MAG33-1920 [uncultured Thermomicrobiales bacterium]|uniref:Uncharacterized protein n=1 Tax=uncultured Thermomicrobiales bacterium TaxID=1645740 RepID=A0A6J4UYM5_9BACT|nr:MAG: hypothetical protein AVDCRST_MAG33-1920 [uncultured Thermomicrobiales bacterium]